MEYAISALARCAGISTRTLRYYEEIGLLIPARINSSGYRIYGDAEVKKLHQILFYKSMGLELGKVKEIMEDPNYDKLQAMERHLSRLKMEKSRMEQLIQNASDTISEMKGEIKMKDQDRFKGFMKEIVEENDKKYGKEIREKYGEEEVEEANRNMMNMSKEEYERWKQLEEQVQKQLTLAVETGDPASEAAMETCRLHKEWLGLCGAKYSKEYHKGLAEMYGADPRFAAYYDNAAPGAAAFLRDAIMIFCQKG